MQPRFMKAAKKGPAAAVGVAPVDVGTSAGKRKNASIGGDGAAVGAPAEKKTALDATGGDGAAVGALAEKPRALDDASVCATRPKDDLDSDRTDKLFRILWCPSSNFT